MRTTARRMVARHALRSQHSAASAAAPEPQPLVTAVVAEARDETSSVRFLRLHVADARFAFAPGQWVDLFAPSAPDQPGGFSLASPPSLLAREGAVELAVKRSKHPAAVWAASAAPGETVQLRVGGAGFSPSQADLARPLLLLAGGIGVTPLAAIARAAAEEATHVRLVYCCREASAFVLLPQLRAAAAQSRGRLVLHLRVTGSEAATLPPGAVQAPRLGSLDLAQQLAEAARAGGCTVAEVTSFICGPPAMTDALEAALRALGQPRERVRFERWW